MPTPYEKRRDENIQRNKELLLALELEELKAYVPPKTTKKDLVPAAKSRKRKSPPQDAEGENESNTKVLKTRAAEGITDASGVRRSARNAGKVVDYKSEVVKTFPEAISHAAKVALESDRKNALERRHDPYVDLSAHRHTTANTAVSRRKQYGHIPDVEIGQWWPTRYITFTFLYIAA